MRTCKFSLIWKKSKIYFSCLLCVIFFVYSCSYQLILFKLLNSFYWLLNSIYYPFNLIDLIFLFFHTYTRCPIFKVLTYYGSAKARKVLRTGWSKLNSFHICITSYQLVVQDANSFRRKRWYYMALDEAHNIKVGIIEYINEDYFLF